MSVQEKEQIAKETNALREKCLDFEGWKHAIEKETLKSDLATNQKPMDGIKKRLSDADEDVPIDTSQAATSLKSTPIY